MNRWRITRLLFTWWLAVMLGDPMDRFIATQAIADATEKQSELAKIGLARLGKGDAMRNLSIAEAQQFLCANCGHRGELDIHGRCETCKSEAVYPDHVPIQSARNRAPHFVNSLHRKTRVVNIA